MISALDCMNEDWRSQTVDGLQRILNNIFATLFWGGICV